MHTEKEACDLVVRNGQILTMDTNRSIFPSGAVAITGGIIKGVGPQQEIDHGFRPRRIIDARGAPVHPGFVDCHIHLTLVARGVFREVRDFTEQAILNMHWWDSTEDEDEYASCLLSCLELLRNGTTCFLEAGTVFEPDCAGTAAETLGIRALVTDPFLWDRGDGPGMKRAPARRDRALDRLGGQLWRNKNRASLVRGHIGLFGMGTASDELALAAKETAEKNATIFTQHQSFTRADAKADDERFGCHPLVHFQQIGLLGKECIFSHMNVTRDDEVRALEESEAAIAWCPAAAMIWGTGGALHGRHAELFRRGIRVGVGSDGPNACGRFDTGLQAFLAVLVARESQGTRDALGAEHALEMATIVGANALGLGEELGSLEPGKRADIVIRSENLPEAQPGIDIPETLIFSGGSKSVDTVIVDGEIVIKNGRSVRIDEQVVYELARAATARMMRRVGLAGNKN